MVELYKIFAEKYDNETTEWIYRKSRENNTMQEIIDLQCNSRMFIMICVNLVSLTESSQHRISDYV